MDTSYGKSRCSNPACRKLFAPHATVSPSANPAAWVRDAFYCSPECEQQGRRWAEGMLGRPINR
jgi:hypothetical protein